MRELGFDESVIAAFREYDWNVFNQEHTYQNWKIPDTDAINENAVSDDSLKVRQPVTVQELQRTAWIPGKAEKSHKPAIRKFSEESVGRKR